MQESTKPRSLAWDGATMAIVKIVENFIFYFIEVYLRLVFLINCEKKQQRVGSKYSP